MISISQKTSFRQSQIPCSTGIYMVGGWGLVYLFTFNTPTHRINRALLTPDPFWSSPPHKASPSTKVVITYHPDCNLHLPENGLMDSPDRTDKVLKFLHHWFGTSVDFFVPSVTHTLAPGKRMNNQRRTELSKEAA